VLTVRQQKTGTTLAIPVHSDLRAILDATPGEHLTFLVTSLGPYTAANFSKQFRECATRPGFPNARRTDCARRPAVGSPRPDARPTRSPPSADMATLKEVERYTRAVDQARMARNAMARKRGRPGNKKVSKLSDV
jgi:hypothetical protein